MQESIVEITEDLAGLRLDKALATALPEFSRARLQSLMLDRQITCGGQVASSPSARVKSGEIYKVILPPPVDPEPEAEAIVLDIVYEDDDLLVINKSSDMVVHPAAGHSSGTLVNALLHHCGDGLSGIGGVKRPGIVHRLDRETSGLMVVAKHDKAHKRLSAQLSDRSLSRVYQAFVWGIPTPREGIIETFMGRDPRDRKKRAVLLSGGKEAVTEYTLLKQYGTLASLVECRLETGRTHQIRVHMAHIKHWLIGDKAYGRPHLNKFLRGRIRLTRALADELQAFPRQALHAAEIGFIHPMTKEYMSFDAPLPPDLQSLQKALVTLNVGPNI